MKFKNQSLHDLLILLNKLNLLMPGEQLIQTPNIWLNCTMPFLQDIFDVWGSVWEGSLNMKKYEQVWNNIHTQSTCYM